MKKDELIIYCDGGSRGNPGPAASAFVVTQDGNVIYKGSKFLGNETNNVAEYTAVLLAVEWLTKQYKVHKQSLPLRGSTEYIVINLDSQLVERQLNGKYKIKNEKLKVLYDQIKNQISNFKFQISFHWGYREKNVLADSLVNEELDLNTSR